MLEIKRFPCRFTGSVLKDKSSVVPSLLHMAVTLIGTYIFIFLAVSSQ